MKCDFTDLNINLSYKELRERYEEALYVISDQQMEILELHWEINDYCQALDELLDELSEYR